MEILSAGKQMFSFKELTIFNNVYSYVNKQLSLPALFLRLPTLSFN